MYRLLLLAIVGLCASAFGYGQLAAGDIAFVGYNTDTTEGFSFIALTDIPANEEIYFTEKGVVNASAWIIGSESTYLFTAPSGGISCGTIVSFLESTPNALTVSGVTGATMTLLENSFNLGSGDQMLAYQYAGSGAAPTPGDATFIAGLTSNYDALCLDAATGWSDASCTNSTSESALPPGLTEGTNAISFTPSGPEKDNFRYTGTLTGTAASLRTAIHDPSNWEKNDGPVYDITPSGYGSPAVTCGAANMAPTVTAPSVPTVLEDATNVALADDIGVADSDGDDQTVTFTITGGTLNVGTAGITFGGGGNGTASFTAAGNLANINSALDAATFSPTTDLNGTNAGTISFTANDGTESTTAASVTFDIGAINDTPSFTKGADDTVNEDSGAQTVNAWATAIDAGATNESGQALTFSVTNDNNALFAAQPAVDASGNLTYTPATDTYGAATVTVQLSDDGGTANGGSDTSAAQTFTITVADVTPPSLSIGMPSANLTNSGPITYTITYTDANAITLAAGDVTLNTSGDAAGDVAITGTGTTERTVSLSNITGNGTIGISIAAQTASDMAGNDALAAGPSATFMVDNTAPTGYSASFDQDPINEDNQNTISISYAGTEVGATAHYNISSSGGGTDITGSGPVPSASGTLTDIDLSSLPDGTISLSFHLTDTAGNMGTNATDTATKDTEKPTVAITSTASNPTMVSPIPVTITFSESVNNFVVGDLVITNGSASNFMGSGTTYSADITPPANADVTVNINADIATDTAGNGNTAATEFRITYNDPPLRVADLILDQDFRLVPNPVANDLYLVTNKPLDLKRIAIFDLHGRQVYQQSLVTSGLRHRIAISNLSAGAYIMSIISKSKQVVQRRLIKE